MKDNGKTEIVSLLLIVPVLRARMRWKIGRYHVQRFLKFTNIVLLYKAEPAA